MPNFKVSFDRSGKRYNVAFQQTEKASSDITVDGRHYKVEGFINAISDQILTAYIPLLEVFPEYQKLGIGKTLV